MGGEGGDEDWITFGLGPVSSHGRVRAPPLSRALERYQDAKKLAKTKAKADLVYKLKSNIAPKINALVDDFAALIPSLFLEEPRCIEEDAVVVRTEPVDTWDV